MRVFRVLLFTLLIGVGLSSAASVNDHFEAIKSDPKALYDFFKTMPKGGELHYHLAGGVYPETLLNIAALGDYCLNPKTTELSKPPACDGVQTSTISPKTALYEQVINTWSMNDEASGKPSDHDQFFATFWKFNPLIQENRPTLLADIMQRAAEQHELYLEIQILPDNADSAKFAETTNSSTPLPLQRDKLLANEKFQANIQHTITESTRILQAARKNLHCDTLPQQAVCTLTVKFQYYVLREQPLPQVFAQALNGFAAAARSEEIVGINLVQAEDGIISMRDYYQQMQIFKYLHKLYPTVNIALHAGELPPRSKSSGPLNYHISNAIFIGHAQRIGHGVNILAAEWNPNMLLNQMANIPIPVEINLTSNRKILGISGKQHPLKHYLLFNVPVVLSTDDEGILRTDLTHEYVEAVITHHLDYETIKNINRNALTYSFLPGQSLWKSAKKQQMVSECHEVNSANCEAFIQKNPKAQLQWQLEKQLAAFEMAY